MFSKALTSTGNFNEKDIQLFTQEARVREVPHGEVLLLKGEVARSIYFLQRGAVYQFDKNADQEYNVIDLHTDNDWFLAHTSFVSQKPSAHYIGAYAHSQLLEISIESIHYLITKSPAFLQLNRVFDNSTSRLHFFDHSLTPLQKYQFIIENKPALLQRFPLKLIASYLKIAPETLSRAREKFASVKILS